MVLFVINTVDFTNRSCSADIWSCSADVGLIIRVIVGRFPVAGRSGFLLVFVCVCVCVCVCFYNGLLCRSLVGFSQYRNSRSFNKYAIMLSIMLRIAGYRSWR